MAAIANIRLILFVFVELASAHSSMFTRSSPMSRERVNFDFSWRHLLGNSTSAPPRQCNSQEKGINYGTGGDKLANVVSAGDCCARCSQIAQCGCWDWNINNHDCWVKSKCNSSAQNSERVSGLLPALPTPSGPPAESSSDFDDSKWAVVDAPHDMLIVQKYDPSAEEKQAFLPRGEGWYRKHFKLPSDWQGSSVFLYIEGSFHRTTAWLNGRQLGPTHKQGYTSWALRLDDVPGVRFGDETNVLALHVDATSGTGWWYEGAAGPHAALLCSTDSRSMPAANAEGLGRREGSQRRVSPTALEIRPQQLGCSVPMTGYEKKKRRYEGGGLMRHNWLVRTDRVHLDLMTAAWVRAENVSVDPRRATLVAAERVFFSTSRRTPTASAEHPVTIRRRPKTRLTETLPMLSSDSI